MNLKTYRRGQSPFTTKKQKINFIQMHPEVNLVYIVAQTVYWLPFEFIFH